MVHGTPDWGLVGPKDTVYGLDDLGEHAVRMGSPHFFDRRGDVVVASDFRDGLGPWVPYLSGLNAALELWTGASRSGAYSLRCVTGSTANFWAGVYKWLPYPVPSKLGLEFSFNIDVLTRYWHGRIRWRTWAQEYDARVRLNHQTANLEYWDGAWQFLAGPLFNVVQLYPSHTLKFVVDTTLAVPEYVRAILDSVAYPMAGFLVENPIAAITPDLFIEVIHYTDVAVNVPAFLDNIIVTQNEP